MKRDWTEPPDYMPRSKRSKWGWNLNPPLIVKAAWLAVSFASLGLVLWRLAA